MIHPVFDGLSTRMSALERRAVADRQASLAGWSACSTAAALALILVAMAGTGKWAQSTIVSTTVNTGNGVTETSAATIYIEGGLSSGYSATMCSISTTNPPPAQRPAASCSAMPLAGTPQAMYVSAGCNTDIASSYKICSALSALIGGSGFTWVLLIAVSALMMLAFVSAVGISYRALRRERAGESPLDLVGGKGAAQDAHGQGQWLRAFGRSLDQASTLMLLLASTLLLGVIYVITWPSAMANALNLVVADLQSQQPSPLPAGYTISYSVSPGPGASYWLGFGAVIFAALAFAPAFSLYRSGGSAAAQQGSSSAASGSGVSSSPLFNPLEAGASGYAPPSGAVEYAALPGPAAGGASASSEPGQLMA